MSGKLAPMIFMSGLYLFMGSFLLLGVQAVLFLKNGTWPLWTLAEVVIPVSPASFLHWVLSPQDWFGLHKVVVTILEVPTVLSGILLGCVFMVMSDW